MQWQSRHQQKHGHGVQENPRRCIALAFAVDPRQQRGHEDQVEDASTARQDQRVLRCEPTKEQRDKDASGVDCHADPAPVDGRIHRYTSIM